MVVCSRMDGLHGALRVLHTPVQGASGGASVSPSVPTASAWRLPAPTAPSGSGMSCGKCCCTPSPGAARRSCISNHLNLPPGKAKNDTGQDPSWPAHRSSHSALSLVAGNILARLNRMGLPLFLDILARLVQVNVFIDTLHPGQRNVPVLAARTFGVLGELDREILYAVHLADSLAAGTHHFHMVSD